jgi:hypothetical protein
MNMAKANRPESIDKSQITKEFGETVIKDTPTKKTSRLAIISMVCVLLALVCFSRLIVTDLPIFGLLSALLFPTAFVVGVIACVVITRRKHLKGYAYTIAPIILGGAFILIMVQIQLAIRMHAYYEKANTARYNLRQLSNSMTDTELVVILIGGGIITILVLVGLLTMLPGFVCWILLIC